MANEPTSPADPVLIVRLLQGLADHERQLDYGAVATVQPYDPSAAPNGTIRIPGYTWEQVDAQLRSLLREGLVHSGTVRNGELLIGIMFAGLTDAGRSHLQALLAGRPAGGAIPTGEEPSVGGYGRGGYGQGGYGAAETPRDVVRLINAVIDQQNSKSRPVAVLHLTDADLQAVLAFKGRHPDTARAHGEPTADDPRPRYRLIPIARSFRDLSFAELGPVFENGQVDSPWLPIDNPSIIMSSQEPPAGLTAAPFRPSIGVEDNTPSAGNAPMTVGGGVARGNGVVGGIEPAAGVVGASGVGTAGDGFGTSPTMGPDYDRDASGNVLTDSNGGVITDSNGEPIEVGAVSGAEATFTVFAESLRPTPPDEAHLPSDAPASLSFSIADGRITVSNERPAADLAPEAVAAMFEAAWMWAGEAVDALIHTNADRRLLEHLQRFRDLLADGVLTSATVFRIGKESAFLLRRAKTLRDEGNDFSADALDALGDYLDRCANQFPVWATFVRNDLAARLSADEVAAAPDVARQLAVGLGGVTALVDPDVPEAFNRLAGSEDPGESESEQRRQAADILGSIRNFFKQLPVPLAVAVTVDAAKGLLDLLFVHPVAGMTINNFIVNAPGWSVDPTRLIDYLRQLAAVLGVPIL